MREKAMKIKVKKKEEKRHTLFILYLYYSSQYA